MPEHFPPPRAAYIHVPFCAHRCGYCDFTLIARHDDLMEAYLAALERELAQLPGRHDVETLFLGGGTPTHLTPAALDRLLHLLQRWFRLTPGGEYSCEANPANFSEAKMDLLAAAGVNRISLGVQSFDPGILQTLERDHSAEQVEAVLHSLRRRFTNISLDLIFGVPGQSLPLWRETLHRALAMATPHLSTYGLTFEKGTTFWGRRLRGVLQPVSDDLERGMYAAAMDELAAAGFAQYELSNFARPGYACRHNQVYWAGGSYFGFGPGAARYIQGRRETNHRGVKTWIQRLLTGKSGTQTSEELPPEERARELLALGLRRAEGISRAEFQQQTRFTLESLIGDTVCKYAALGLLEDDGKNVRLTRAGRFVADSIVVDCL